MFIISGRPLRAVSLAVAIMAFTAVLRVQADPAPPYETLITRLDQTPYVIEAEALRDSAEARVRQVGALPNPALTLEAENAYGNGPYTGYDSAETTLSISQPLELWGRREARIEAARVESDAALLRRDQSHSIIAGRIALAYVEAEAAAIRHDLAMEALALAEADAEAAQVLVNEGREANLRAVQSESDVAIAHALKDEARAHLDASLARLTALAPVDLAVTSIRVNLLDRAPEPAVVEPGNLIAARLAEVEVDAFRSQVAVERLRARPDLTASLGVRRFEASGDEALTFGVSVSLPLFDRNRGAISAALAEQRAAEARLTALQRETSAEHHAALIALRASSSRIRAAERGIASAAEAYRLARIGFDAGRISELELRSSRAVLIAARNTDLEARLARARAEIDLARLEGRIPFGEAL